MRYHHLGGRCLEQVVPAHSTCSLRFGSRCGSSSSSSSSSAECSGLLGVVILPSRSGTTVSQISPNPRIPALLTPRPVQQQVPAPPPTCVESLCSHCARWLPSSPPRPQNLLAGSLPRTLLPTAPRWSGLFNASLIPPSCPSPLESASGSSSSTNVPVVASVTAAAAGHGHLLFLSGGRTGH